MSAVVLPPLVLCNPSWLVQLTTRAPEINDTSRWVQQGDPSLFLFPTCIYLFSFYSLFLFPLLYFMALFSLACSVGAYPPKRVLGCGNRLVFQNSKEWTVGELQNPWRHGGLIHSPFYLSFFLHYYYYIYIFNYFIMCLVLFDYPCNYNLGRDIPRRQRKRDREREGGVR